MPINLDGTAAGRHGFWRISVGLFRPYRRDSDKAKAVEPDTTAATSRKKAGPTPTRAEAEKARMERLHPNLSKRQIRAREAQVSRSKRAEAFKEVEQRPERVLLRNYIDSRWTLLEFLFPTLLILLAFTFVSSSFPSLVPIVTMITWGIFGAAFINGILMWRGFKRELAQRHPRATTKGLLMYGISRMAQIRRFRQPPAVIRRGEEY